MATGKGNRRKRRPQKGKPDNPAQSKRFIEAAQKLGVDTSTEAFEEVMRSILKPKDKRGNS